MTTSADRRNLAMRAIAQVQAGGTAKDFETEIIDFKEESGSHGPNNAVVQIGPRSDAAGRELATEAACMANTDNGGVLIVGVRDKDSGDESFVGAQSEIDWLRVRIHNLTQPSLFVTIEEIFVAGKRILLIDVPESMSEIRVNGKLQTRLGTNCFPLDGEAAVSFMQSRRNFDWSAQSSGMHLSDAVQEALASARAHYSAAKGLAPASDRELVNRLGVLANNEDDPELTRAGALMLCNFEPSIQQIQLVVSTSESVASRLNIAKPAPLLTLFDEVMSLLMLDAFPATEKFVGLQRMYLRKIPQLALREAVVNGIIHRDYRISTAQITIQAIGDPCEIFKVISPGGLVPGVTLDSLISTPSRPRNTNLAEAFRILGLAEKEGTGIDRIYSVMLKEGHPAPEITENPAGVVFRLTGGNPNLATLEFFSDLGAQNPNLVDDVRVILALDYLLKKATIQPESLSILAQCSAEEAKHTLNQLETISVIERLVNGGYTYRLTQSSKSLLASLISYQLRTPFQDQAEIVLSYLDSHSEVSREDVKTLLNISDQRATTLLREMVAKDKLEFVGPKRGRSVRYKRFEIHFLPNSLIH